MIELGKRESVYAFLCALPFLVVIVLFELMPIIAVLLNSVHANGELSIQNYVDILTSGFYLAAFKSSFGLSLLTAIIALILALPIANVLRRMPARVQDAILVFSNIGTNFTGYPLAFAFVILMGVSGSITLLLVDLGLVRDFNIYSTTGLILVFSYFQILLAVLLLFPALGAITPDINEAAQLMGATRWSFWRRIGLPILRPSLAAAFLLLFANAMGTYATVEALVGSGANLVTIRIGELTSGDVFSDPNLADTMATLLVIILIVPILAAQSFLKPKTQNA
jgi:putative spermidine/putrescine transport system permease protein